MSVQFAELSASPDVIVATPGRLLHHLSEIPGFNLKNTRHIVLDEADRLFEMGLGSQVCMPPNESQDISPCLRVDWLNLTPPEQVICITDCHS